jgi:hypothetical protein
MTPLIRWKSTRCFDSWLVWPPNHSKYTPKMNRAYQQCITTAISPYSYPAIPVSVWRSTDRPTLAPKLRSLAWLIHTGGYKTTKSYARFTNTSLVCPHCQQATESVEHALAKYQRSVCLLVWTLSSAQVLTIQSI